MCTYIWNHIQIHLVLPWCIVIQPINKEMYIQYIHIYAMYIDGDGDRDVYTCIYIHTCIHTYIYTLYFTHIHYIYIFTTFMIHVHLIKYMTGIPLDSMLSAS